MSLLVLFSNSRASLSLFFTSLCLLTSSSRLSVVCLLHSGFLGDVVIRVGVIVDIYRQVCEVPWGRWGQWGQWQGWQWTSEASYLHKA